MWSFRKTLASRFDWISRWQRVSIRRANNEANTKVTKSKIEVTKNVQTRNGSRARVIALFTRNSNQKKEATSSTFFLVPRPSPFVTSVFALPCDSLRSGVDHETSSPQKSHERHSQPASHLDRKTRGRRDGSQNGNARDQRLLYDFKSATSANHQHAVCEWQSIVQQSPTNHLI